MNAKTHTWKEAYLLNIRDWELY